MSYLRIWIHLVWSTKNRAPVLIKGIRGKIFDHIRSNARAKEIHLSEVGGFTDHIHCLVSLKPEQSIAKVVQLIKGESAYWINKEGLLNTHFNWQSEYYAESISEADLSRLIHYIQNQEIHHKQSTFSEEYKSLLSSIESNSLRTTI